MSFHDLTKSYLPTVAVATLLVVISGVIWSWAILFNKVETSAQELGTLRGQIDETPTRREFDLLNSKVDEIGRNTQEIIKMLASQRR